MENTINFANNPRVMAATAELIGTAMEVNRANGVQIWVNFVGHVNWLETRVAIGTHQNAEKMAGPDYLNLECHAYGDTDEEIQTEVEKSLEALLANIEDKRQQLIALGARYGGLTDEEIQAMGEAELNAKETAQLDESIASVEKKLEAMKAERERKTGGK